MEQNTDVSAHSVPYEQLIAYLLGELDPAGSAQVARHVVTCDRCSKTISRFEMVRATLREDDTRTTPYHTSARANAIYAHYRPAQPKWQWNWRSRPMAFAGGFALAVILLMGLATIIADLDIQQDNVLYPAKVTVQGMEVALVNTSRRLGIGQSPSKTSPTRVTSSPTEAPVALPDVVISQIYGGGGNTGATLTHDFIELFNRGNTMVSLAGWSVQYTSATGMSTFGAAPTQITELPNISLAPGHYLLIQEAKGSGGTTQLPAPDVIDPTPIALSATGGKVVLVNRATPLGCNGGLILCPPSGLESIVDIVGYGNADFFNGVGPAPAGSNTTSILRANGGCAKSGQNSSDFVPGPPTPRNSNNVFRCP